MQLDKALDLFYNARSADGASSATVRWYRQRLKRLGEFFGESAVEALGVDDLREFVVHLRSKSQRWADHPYRKPSDGGLSSSTVRGYVRAVKRFFNWLEEEEILEQHYEILEQVEEIYEEQQEEIVEEVLTELPQFPEMPE